MKASARDMCYEIEHMIRTSGAMTDIVNEPALDEDSVIESQCDLDVTYQGFIYNVQINVVRFCAVEALEPAEQEVP